MRRLTLLGVLVLAAGAGLVLTGTKEEGSQTYRVDALFYNAAHLIPGQQVKIAGAEVGSVEDVKLTKDRRARIQMLIDERFAPFRVNAKCRIRPQSLIGEKYVQCDPGSAKAAELRPKGDEVATVPVTRNEVPVDLDLVFASLRMPYRERLSLIVNELGTGLAGRPEELNTAIRQANPALKETQRVLEIVDGDRAELGRLIDASDKVIAELARKRRTVASFVDRAGVVADEVASKRGDLGTAIERLPPMLDELEPTANDLATLGAETRPVLRDVREATPAVRALAADLDPLNDAARPALMRLAEMSRTGRSAVRAATPIAALLRPVTEKLPPVVTQATALFESMREMGVVEGLQGFVYFASLATSRFDRYSHILPSYQVAGTCQQFASAPAAGCDAHFAGSTERPGAVNDKRASRKRKTEDRKQKTERGRQSTVDSRQGSGSDLPAGRQPPAPASGQPPAASPQPPPPPTPADQLLDFLLSP